MNYTKTQIVNQALFLIGERALSNADTDTGKPAEIAREVWPFVLADVQRAFEWQECRRRVELTAHPDLSSDELNRFALPADFLRMLKVSPETDQECVYWRLEENFLLTDETSPVEVEIIVLKTSPSDWSQQLVTATIHFLAHKLAHPVSNNENMAAFHLQLYEKVLGEARLEQARNNTSREYRPRRTGNWLASRGQRRGW